MAGQEIRSLVADDLNEVLAIERASYEFPWSKPVMSDCLLNSRYHNLALLVDDRIVAYSICSRVLDELSLLNLCVAPESRRKGLARQLLQYVIDQARVENVKLIYLEVRESNLAAQNLYRDLDFNEVGSRPGYYPARTGTEDAILMTLQLELDMFV